MPEKKKGYLHTPINQTAIELGLLTAEQFDKWVVPVNMTHP